MNPYEFIMMEILLFYMHGYSLTYYSTFLMYRRKTMSSCTQFNLFSRYISIHLSLRNAQLTFDGDGTAQPGRATAAGGGCPREGGRVGWARCAPGCRGAVGGGWDAPVCGFGLTPCPAACPTSRAAEHRGHRRNNAGAVEERE